MSILVEFGTVSSLKKGNLRSSGFVRARAQTRLVSSKARERAPQSPRGFASLARANLASLRNQTKPPASQATLSIKKT